MDFLKKRNRDMIWFVVVVAVALQVSIAAAIRRSECAEWTEVEDEDVDPKVREAFNRHYRITDSIAFHCHPQFDMMRMSFRLNYGFGQFEIAEVYLRCDKRITNLEPKPWPHSSCSGNDDLSKCRLPSGGTPNTYTDVMSQAFARLQGILHAFFQRIRNECALPVAAYIEESYAMLSQLKLQRVLTWLICSIIFFCTMYWLRLC